jgi:hypothetical protein
MLLTATMSFKVIEKGNQMFDVARTIQEDRRHQAEIQRIASNLPRERSLSVGRYRVTVSKRSGRALPAA